MISIKNVLCPTDFSKYADHALSYGVEFCTRFGATLHLHHSVTTPYMSVAYEIGPETAIARDQAEKEARRLIDARAADLRSKTLNVQTHITVGVPFIDIIQLGREKQIDLIVIATHGRTGLQQIMIGSTAERVVRKSPCPVLTVRHPEHEFVLP